jgi:hypothetical protein
MYQRKKSDTRDKILAKKGCMSGYALFVFWIVPARFLISIWHAMMGALFTLRGHTLSARGGTTMRNRWTL